ncbi:uncharacterized protein [Miscanthus floridulus]|uniref:uncharacterized protein n=1 Tax=Miscanthus floridulus TaxID=154761 RepID=UPI0034577B46
MAASSSPGGARAVPAGGGGGGPAVAVAVTVAASGVSVGGGAGGRGGAVEPARAGSTPVVAAAVVPDIIVGVDVVAAEPDLDGCGSVEGRGGAEASDLVGMGSDPPSAAVAAVPDAGIRTGGHGSRGGARMPDPAASLVGRIGEEVGEEEGEGEGRAGGADAWEAAGAAGGGGWEAVRRYKP